MYCQRYFFTPVYMQNVISTQHTNHFCCMITTHCSIPAVQVLASYDIFKNQQFFMAVVSLVSMGPYVNMVLFLSCLRHVQHLVRLLVVTTIAEE